MVKYCPKCGAQNTDDSVFCVSCGANLNDSTQSQQQNTQVPPPPPGWVPPEPLGQQAKGGEKGRVERAFDELFAHLNIVIPLVLLFVFTIIVYIIALVVSFGLSLLSHFSIFGHVFGVIGFITSIIIYLAFGLILFITSYEALQALKKQPYSVSEGVRFMRANAGTVVSLIVIFALVEVAFSYVPFVGVVLNALGVAYFVTAFIEPTNLYDSLMKPFNLFEKMSKDDSLSLVVLVVLGLLSVIPLIYVFTAPAAILIALIYYQDKGLLQPNPPPLP